MNERTINSGLLISWIEKNGPNGELKLAEKSKVSYHTISRIRSGYVPKKDLTRQALATALGVKYEVLFPLVSAKEKTRAS